MSAEVLREAAALMRTRAENSATAMVGPLTWTAHFGGHDSMTSLHYQSWHPTVALAVADWLDACALVTEIAPDRHKGLALAVARAYLGEAS